MNKEELLEIRNRVSCWVSWLDRAPQSEENPDAYTILAKLYVQDAGKLVIAIEELFNLGDYNIFKEEYRGKNHTGGDL